MEYGYYGVMDEVSPTFRRTKGVQYFMLDQHIKKIIDKQIEIFSDKIAKIVKSSENDYDSVKEILRDLEKSICQINKKLGIENKTKRKLSSKSKTEEDDEDDF